MAQSIEEFSYQLSAEALADQERSLNALRARAGTIVAAASISGSFLGAKVSHSSIGGWSIAALVAFAFCLASTIWVLLPQELVFAFRGEALLAASDHEGRRRCHAGISCRWNLDRAIPGYQPGQDRTTLELVHRELRATRN